MEYRNELKYICTEKDFEIIRHRLKVIMLKDKNLKNEDGYNIRSIYFDNYNNDFFYQNDAGVNDRIKVRIRIYDKSKETIKLEIKAKKNAMTKKNSCLISEKVFYKLINGTISFEECNNKVLRQVFIMIKTELLKPKVIVEYDRYVFINKIGNVRITFDKNIRVSDKIERFFEDNIYATPIQEIGNHVLEIKFDEILPDYITTTLELGTLTTTSFSKYYLSMMKYIL